MVVISEVGGVRVYGEQASSWQTSEGRQIDGIEAEFDSDVYWPDVSKSTFVLPAHRGHPNYKVHLLDEGALVLKEGRAFLCTVSNGQPKVLHYNPAPADSADSVTASSL